MEYDIGVGPTGGELNWGTLTFSGGVSATDFLESVYASSQIKYKDSVGEDLVVAILSDIDGEFNYRVDFTTKKKHSYVTVICKEKEPS